VLVERQLSLGEHRLIQKHSVALSYPALSACEETQQVPSPTGRSAVLNVVYMGYDLRDQHPVARLLSPIVWSHNRTRVSVTFINYGPSRLFQNFTFVLRDYQTLPHTCLLTVVSDVRAQLSRTQEAFVWLEYASVLRDIGQSCLNAAGFGELWAPVTSADQYFAMFGASDDEISQVTAAQRPDVIVDTTGVTQGHRPAAIAASIAASCRFSGRHVAILGFLARLVRVVLRRRGFGCVLSLVSAFQSQQGNLPPNILW
jgi:hypothetical protein